MFGNTLSGTLGFSLDFSHYLAIDGVADKARSSLKEREMDHDTLQNSVWNSAVTEGASL